MSLATVIIPTFDHGPLLRFAIESVLLQTVQDFEVVVIGDGVPPAVRPQVEKACARDARIRFLERPKSARTGERWRHEALSTVSSEIVCYLCDDDLWMPDHLERVSAALRDADFANGWALRVQPDGRTVASAPWVLAHPAYRRALQTRANRIGLSCVAHRLDAYRRLPWGWRETPPGTATDRYMWLQWVDTPGMRFASVLRLSVLGFPAGPRSGWTVEQRCAELEQWLARLSSKDGLARIRTTAITRLLRAAASLEIASYESQDRLQAIAQLASARAPDAAAGEVLAEIARLASLETS